jgi:hypothetical protein
MPRMPEKRPGAGSLLMWTAPLCDTGTLTETSGDDVTHFVRVKRAISES